MELTGKAAEEFSEYYNEKYGNIYFGNDNCFNGLPIAMRYSVIVDFFETKNIVPDVANLEIPHNGEFEDKYCATVQTPEKYYHIDFTDDVDEARILVINEANKMYNLKSST